MPRRRRSAEELLRSRTIDWQLYLENGFALRTACRACGMLDHCRGKHRDTVRCWPCVRDGHKVDINIGVGVDVPA